MWKILPLETRVFEVIEEETLEILVPPETKCIQIVFENFDF